MEPYLESLDVAQRDFTGYVKALDPQAITIADISPGDLLASLEYVASYPIPREIKLTQAQRLASHERYLRLQATFNQSTKLLNDKAVELGESLLDKLPDLQTQFHRLCLLTNIGHLIDTGQKLYIEHTENLKKTDDIQKILMELEVSSELTLACAVAAAQGTEGNVAKAREMLRQFKANLVGTIEDRSVLLDRLALSRRGLLDTRLPNVELSYQLKLKEEFIELQRFLIDALVKRYNQSFNPGPPAQEGLADHLVKLFDKIRTCEAQIIKDTTGSAESGNPSQKEHNAIASSIESHTLRVIQMITSRNDWESKLAEVTLLPDYLNREDFLQLLVSAETLVQKANAYISRVHQLLDKNVATHGGDNNYKELSYQLDLLETVSTRVDISRQCEKTKSENSRRIQSDRVRSLAQNQSFSCLLYTSPSPRDS